MPHTLIMPKQTGQLDAFLASLKLYYQSREKGEEWYSNNDFKVQIQQVLPYTSAGAKDGPYLVKQSELTRYFGLVKYDYSSSTHKGQITNRGVEFYKAYQNNDVNLQKDIIINAILTDSFGRNNTAIKESDSDVDPPKLFLKAMYDLQGINRKDLAYLLYVTHDKQISYNDALVEFKSVAAEREINIPQNVSNKYSDVKFTVLLTALGICEEIDNKYHLSQYTLNNFGNRIINLSIYNREPEAIFTLSEEVINDGGSILTNTVDDMIGQDNIVSSYPYDITSDKFIKQNNRTPLGYKTTSGGIKYKTNPRISKTALCIANYKCQMIQENHQTFVSKFGLPYMEAHHLIPMHAQKDFAINLDRIENIVSICPTCHSAIHLGNDATRLEYLKKLYDERINDLNKAGIQISFGDLFTKYYK